MTPPASFIIRTKDKADVLPRAINTVRTQTVAAEIVVVDSGSSDGTLALARTYADTVVELAPEAFSYGRALNAGAEAARGSVHVALSAHCWLPRRDWLERALAHYEDRRVAAAMGGRTDPGGTPLDGPYVLRSRCEVRPWFGFSNHGSSWRADVWRRHPFDERLEASEDREWMWRVVDDAHRFVFDPKLIVEPSRVRSPNPWHLLGKTRREVRALGAIGALEPLTGAEALRVWWRELPGSSRLPRRLYLLHPNRTARIAGRWLGSRDALARATPDRPVNAWFRSTG
jgi:rhamnosyltransferase